MPTATSLACTDDEVRTLIEHTAMTLVTITPAFAVIPSSGAVSSLFLPTD
jgi:hypothetical protein